MRFKKLLNALKVYASYCLSKYWGFSSQWGLPITVAMEPTTSCNLRCPECPSGLRAFTRPTGMLNTADFKKNIDELAPAICSLTFYFQGEPYLNPQFLDMVAYASKKNIYTFTSTNAHYLTDDNARKTIESGLDRLIISIDGTTQETYEQYRVGGDLEKVIAGTRNIIRWKKELNSRTPHIIFQFLVVAPNEHQIDEMKLLAKSIGVDELKFKTAQVYNYKNGNALIPTNQKYARYKKIGPNAYALKNKLSNNCWRLWHAPVITWDGVVVPCCFDKDATHQMGDLKKQSFKQIWQADVYKKFRANILKSRKEIDICANCTEGTKVWEN